MNDVEKLYETTFKMEFEKRALGIYIQEDYPHDYIVITFDDGSDIRIEYDYIYSIEWFNNEVIYKDW